MLFMPLPNPPMACFEFQERVAAMPSSHPNISCNIIIVIVLIKINNADDKDDTDDDDDYHHLHPLVHL